MYAGAALYVRTAAIIREVLVTCCAAKFFIASSFSACMHTTVTAQTIVQVRATKWFDSRSYTKVDRTNQSPTIWIHMTTSHCTYHFTFTRIPSHPPFQQRHHHHRKYHHTLLTMTTMHATIAIMSSQKSSPSPV